MDPIKQTKMVAQSCLLGVVMPRISERLLREMAKNPETDFRLLGKAVGKCEKMIAYHIDNIDSEKKLKKICDDFQEDRIESQIRSSYLSMKLNYLMPALNKLISQVAAIEKDLSQFQQEKVNQIANQMDIIDALKAEYGLNNMSA